MSTGQPNGRDIAAGLALGHVLAHQHHHDGIGSGIPTAAAYWAGITTDSEHDDLDEDVSAEDTE
jgi:hypothetical protein